MATLSRGITFGSTETVTNTKLHNLVDLGGVSGILNSDCASNMALVDTKLADITTGGKVRGTAILNLPSIPSGAGILPLANIPLINTSWISFASGSSIPNLALQPLTLVSWVDGAAFRNLTSSPSLAGQLPYWGVVSSLASGALPMYDGANKLVGTAKVGIPINIQVFTSSGTWTRPVGISTVYVKVIGRGGNGAAGASGSGGGYAEGLIAVTGDVTVTIGATNSFAGTTTIQATSGTNGSGTTPGTGGSGSNGTINISGTPGQSAVGLSPGGAGGGSAMGPGGLGASVTGPDAGNDGGKYGGGGGGGNDSQNTSGGTGDAGAVIVYY